MRRSVPPCHLEATMGSQRICCRVQPGLPPLPLGILGDAGGGHLISQNGGPHHSPLNKIGPFTLIDPQKPALPSHMHVCSRRHNIPRWTLLASHLNDAPKRSEAGPAPLLPMPRGGGRCFPRHVLPSLQRPPRHPQMPTPPSCAAHVPHFNRLQDPRWRIFKGRNGFVRLKEAGYLF